MARFTASPEVAARRAIVLQRHGIEHHSYAQIAADLGIAPATARSDYKRALDQLQADQKAAAATARDVELAKLDALEEAVWEVLRRKHVTVSHGKIICREDGTELEDDAPVLAAADRLVRIAQRRATLTGMDAPARVEVSDATDAEIRRLAAELAAAAGVGDVERGREAAAAGHAAEGQG